MTARIDGFRQALDSERVSPFFYGVIGLLALLLLTDGFGTQSMGFVAPVITKAWALKKGAITVAVTTGLIGVMLGACGVTPVADKIGARRILVACAVSYGVLLMGTALVTDLTGLAWMRLFTGLALGGAMPAAIAIVSEYSPTRLRAMLVTVAVCGFSVGGALGGVANTVLIARHGWQSVFVAGGVLPIVLAPLLYLWLPESLPRVLIGKASARAMAAVRKIAPHWSPSTGGPVEAPVSHIPVVGLFQDGFALPTVLIWVVYFMNLMVLYTLSQMLPTIVTDAGMPLSTASAATSYYQLGGIAGALLFSYGCDRFGSRLILPAIFIGTSVFCFLIGVAGRDPGLVVGAATSAGVFVIGGQAVANAFVGNFYGSHIRATGIGWALGMGRLGAIVGPAVIGVLDGAGARPQTLFELCAIPGLFAAAATWFLARNQRPVPAAPPGAAAAAAKA